MRHEEMDGQGETPEIEGKEKRKQHNKEDEVECLNRYES